MSGNTGFQIEIANFPCDLHCHSTRSDGADSVRELIDRAVAQGMKIIALTDHDIVPPEAMPYKGGEVEPAAYAAERGLYLLKGMEISCETEVEDVHIVCLGCSWRDSFFTGLQEAVAGSKIESYSVLVERLKAGGVGISWEELLENGGSPVAESRIQKKMIFELMARKGYCADWSEAKLMVKNTPAYRVNRKKPCPGEVIKEIHRCGGIAILAHPYLIPENFSLNGSELSRDEYISGLIDCGLDGIEASYTYNKTSYSGTKSAEEICSEIMLKYAGRVSVMSGGSDYHADFKKGVKNARFIGECGVTEEYFYDSKILRSLLPR